VDGKHVGKVVYLIAVSESKPIGYLKCENENYES
jgi:hypothetical protein